MRRASKRDGVRERQRDTLAGDGDTRPQAGWPRGVCLPAGHTTPRPCRARPQGRVCGSPLAWSGGSRGSLHEAEGTGLWASLCPQTTLDASLGLVC